MECNKCQDGFVYTCNNCWSVAIYDYEFGTAFCDTCEILKEEYSVSSSECSICNKTSESDKSIKKYILFFDTETTGLPKNWKAPISDIQNWPRLVQLAYQIFDEKGTKIKEKDIIIYPDGFSIPDDSYEIHRISNEKAISIGKPIIEVLKEFIEEINFVDVIVGHNLEYDLNIIGCELIRANLQSPLNSKTKICTMKSSTNFCAIDGPYGYKWPSLAELHLKLFNSTFEEAHNALIDINITSKCFWELEKLKVISIIKDNKVKTKPLLVPCFIVVNDEKKYGYMYSETKKLAIKCQFDYTYHFKGNIAKVINRGNINYMTLNGYLIQPYESYRGNLGFDVGLVPAKASRELNPLSTEIICGYIDTESEEIIKIPFEYSRVYDFNNGYAVVNKGSKWGVIDINGNVVIPIVYQWLNVVQNILFVAKINDKWGVIDINNNHVLPVIYDNYWQSKNETYHTLSKDGKFGFYDVSLNKFYGLIYDGASQFSEDCAPIKIRGKWGYIDKSWNTILPFDFDEAESFNNGFAAVKKGKLWGFINIKGDLILPYIYKNVGSFRDEIAQVEYPLNLKQKFQIFISGKYERVLHKININGESISSWKSLVEYKN